MTNPNRYANTAVSLNSTDGWPRKMLTNGFCWTDRPGLVNGISLPTDNIAFFVKQLVSAPAWGRQINNSTRNPCQYPISYRRCCFSRAFLWLHRTQSSRYVRQHARTYRTVPDCFSLWLFTHAKVKIKLLNLPVTEACFN
jgi:hypothetical protein